MPTNLYFTQGKTSEQNLYEDLIVESLKIYGQETYYIPREIVNRDTIFDDDSVSRFERAYQLEMYIENIEGFDGDGDLFTKFGVEIRDACTFVVSRRRFLNRVAVNENDENDPYYRPREGDLIYLKLSGSIFEITKVEDESPFYQLKDLPTFRLRAELFEYNDEDFDTGRFDVDVVEQRHAYVQIVTLSALTGTFEVGESVTQVNANFTMRGEVVELDNSGANPKIHIAHQGATDGNYHSWTTTADITGDVSGAVGTPSNFEEDMQVESMNDNFNTVSQGGTIDFIDFDESNPFGDP